MKIILLWIIGISLFAGTSFITTSEYASSLYKNPRGIGCDQCHGQKGHGKLIAVYTHKGHKKEFRGDDITKMDFTQFYRALNKHIFGMPRYYLTREEIMTLYKYLNHQNTKK
jgi:hypothetical protein